MPALLTIAVLFAYPLAFSIVTAFRADGFWTFDNFVKSVELYRSDILFTLLIVGVSTILIGCISVLIGGYLTLGGSPTAIASCAGSTDGRSSFPSSLRDS